MIPRNGIFAHARHVEAVCVALVLAVWALSMAGCAPGLPEVLTPYDLQNDPDGDGSLETARAVEWEEDTARAIGGISIDPANMLTVRSFLGSEIIGVNMPPASEVDVFALGMLERGDQISVSVHSLIQQIVNLTPLAQAEIIRTTSAQSVLLVDGNSEIVGYPAAAPVAVDVAGDYFIVVHSFVPGDYVFNITRMRGAGPRPPRRGVLLLQFGGSDSDVTFLDPKGKLLRVRDLPPFHLEDARPDFMGQTDRFQETMRKFIDSIYADYDVQVTLDPQEAAAADYYDTMVFTTPSPGDLGFSQSGSRTLGVEPSIDVEDQGGQMGIVFIHGYEPSRYMDFNSYAAFWSSVAAHEYGHAVGLWHVAQESRCLMTPNLGGAGEARRLKLLLPADKAEINSQPPLRLIQNPDRYLSRVLGRRTSDSAEAARQAARDLLPDFVE